MKQGFTNEALSAIEKSKCNRKVKKDGRLLQAELRRYRTSVGRSAEYC